MMKAIRPRFSLRLCLAAALAAFAASCAAPPPPPPPRPPAPRPIYRPPAAPVVPAPDWRDRPITPGDWRWSPDEGVSSARFADGAGAPLLEFRCDRASRAVLMIRSGGGADPTSTTITTTSTTRTLSAHPRAAPTPLLIAGIPAGDPLLDAIAFSRGRFAVETQGLPTLYLPSWPEVARVIEDCR